ncbi:arrestin domain-containing protein 2-like isoform X1 [Cottoperca gobio]|uniref:Arrestin domain-containing protein 2-like isoform X1 n=1 Tax=Cottoperca gobio TaxID=56716 RepID=A0A6J2PJH7_COTGO|nr:arrestin domain-containing protein 2-like isoform X1 [Cottoperca gobio]
MTLNTIKSFKLELDGPADAAFTGGEVVSGQVVLELRKDTRVHSMKVQGRGVAIAHWLENRGMNSVYNDYTSKITYFRKRQHLIRALRSLYHGGVFEGSITHQPSPEALHKTIPPPFLASK